MLAAKTADASVPLSRVRPLQKANQDNHFGRCSSQLKKQSNKSSGRSSRPSPPSKTQVSTAACIVDNSTNPSSTGQVNSPASGKSRESERSSLRRNLAQISRDQKSQRLADGKKGSVKSGHSRKQTPSKNNSQGGEPSKFRRTDSGSNKAFALKPSCLVDGESGQSDNRRVLRTRSPRLNLAEEPSQPVTFGGRPKKARKNPKKATNRSSAPRQDDEEYGSKPAHAKKRTQKASTKPIPGEKRQVKEGVSVFDLIMPWKLDVAQKKQDAKEKKQLPSESIPLTQDLPNLAAIANQHKLVNLQAILVSPPWKDFTKNEGDGGLSTEEFFTFFQVPGELLDDGLIFIWVEKDNFHEVIKGFKSQNIEYVENVCYVMLDQTKKQKVDETRNIDISESYTRTEYKYLRKAKRTMLIFRRQPAKSTLQLRHQRTCDVVFDWSKLDDQFQNAGSNGVNYDGNIRKPDYRPNDFIYQMIETMLPKATEGMNEQGHENLPLRLLEIYPQSQECRKGWFKVWSK